MKKIFSLLVIGFILGNCSSDNTDLKKRVKKIVLDNGMKVLLLKREGAPVFSARIQVKVGNVEEERNLTGLAHFFEHMAFKGTDKIGTRDFKKEEVILKQILDVGTKLTKLKSKGAKPEEYADLAKKLKALQKEQKKYIVNNEFTQIYQKNGGVQFNATTSNDFTTYYVSFPSNKLELWAYLESTRLQNVVLREFFTERDVIGEERRMRVDNRPDGLLYEALIDKAFTNSPYKVHVIGKPEHINSYTPKKALEFYKRYYIPSRMVLTLVGNFDEDKAEDIVRKYFSKLPKKKDHPVKIKPEPLNKDGKFKRVTIKGKEKPRFYLSYLRPNYAHDDDIVMDVIREVMCGGKTSRLYKKLVLEQRKVSYIGCYASFPGGRLSSLFTFYGIPFQGHRNNEIMSLVKKEIHLLGEEGPTDKELQIVKNNMDADLIYSLDSNFGLASQLAYYESLTGDWKYIYKLQDTVHKVTKDDIKRVVKKYFVPERETAAFYETEK